jgi:hypothetical protein
MALAVRSPHETGIDALARQRDLLAQRLETGFQRIERAEREGRDVSEWEQLWISLLHEYEAVCRNLNQRV